MTDYAAGRSLRRPNPSAWRMGGSPNVTTTLIAFVLAAVYVVSASAFGPGYLYDRTSILARQAVDAPVSEFLQIGTSAPATRGGTRIFRAGEPDELADLVGSGAFRTGPGLEGKYFWPTRTQADDFAAMASKANMGGPY